jgi:hypothetical protein
MDIMTSAIHLQTYLAGLWHDAAVVTFAADDPGHRGATTLDYEIDDCLALDPEMTGSVSGIQALSVAFPISRNGRSSRIGRLSSWTCCPRATPG